MSWFSRYRRRRAQKRIDRWNQYMRSMAGVTVSQGLLKAVNAWWNDDDHLSYKEDSADNKWKTPQESLYDGYGDCEDIAIGKMETLRRCGVSKEQLKLIHVRVPEGDHMVLGYYDEGNSTIDPLILDNLSPLIQLLSEKDGWEFFYATNWNGMQTINGLAETNSRKWVELEERLS